MNNLATTFIRAAAAAVSGAGSQLLSRRLGYSEATSRESAMVVALAVVIGSNLWGLYKRNRSSSSLDL
jgi:hypothetical protein